MILVLGCIQNLIFVFKVVWGHEHECRLTPEHKDLGEGKEIFIRYYSYITLALNRGEGGGGLSKIAIFAYFQYKKCLLTQCPRAKWVF